MELKAGAGCLCAAGYEGMDPLQDCRLCTKGYWKDSVADSACTGCAYLLTTTQMGGRSASQCECGPSVFMGLTVSFLVLSLLCVLMHSSQRGFKHDSPTAGTEIVEMRDCCVCFETLRYISGISCEAGLHFYCNTCFNAEVKVQCDLEDFGAFKQARA